MHTHNLTPFWSTPMCVSVCIWHPNLKHDVGWTLNFDGKIIPTLDHAVSPSSVCWFTAPISPNPTAIGATVTTNWILAAVYLTIWNNHFFGTLQSPVLLFFHHLRACSSHFHASKSYRLLQTRDYPRAWWWPRLLLVEALNREWPVGSWRSGTDLLEPPTIYKAYILD